MLLNRSMNFSLLLAALAVEPIPSFYDSPIILVLNITAYQGKNSPDLNAETIFYQLISYFSFTLALNSRSA